LQFEFGDVEDVAVPFGDEDELAELLLSEWAAVANAIAIAAAQRAAGLMFLSSCR